MFHHECIIHFLDVKISCEDIMNSHDDAWRLLYTTDKNATMVVCQWK